MPLPNVTQLRNSLREAGYCMTAFTFEFNYVECFVIFEDARALGREAKYVSVILTFRDLNDADHFVEVTANAGGIDLDSSNKREFYEFFHIKYGEFNDFWKRFNEELNAAIPPLFIEPENDKIVNVVTHQLGVRTNEPDPNAIYCYSAYRLPVDSRTGKQMHRSPFMDQKTRMLRPRLYERIHAETEPTITFRYSADDSRDLLDEDILRQFALTEAERMKQ